MFSKFFIKLRESASYKLAIHDAISIMSTTRPREPLACSDWYDARDELIKAVSILKNK